MRKFYGNSFKLGILGGGQLGRMFIQEAVNYDVRVSVLDPSPDAPCSKISHEFICGDFKDYESVLQFGKNCDLLTIEIENVNVEALKELESLGIPVFPQPRVLEVIKDKGLQKQFYQSNQIPTAPFELVNSKEEAISKLSEGPWMMKLRTGGYDGRGVCPLRNEADLEKVFDAPSVLEKMIDFEKEIAIMVARSESGQVSTFPAVEMEFNPEAHLVEFLFSPANITSSQATEAENIAVKIAEKLGIVGVLAVEMFVTKQGEILVNEIAPRPHNSGHQTIEGNVCSQYEQHLRAITNMPLGDTSLITPSVMVNILGEKRYEGPVHYEGLDEILSIPGVFVHLYGKTETKPFRKMGHVTVIDMNLEMAKAKARKVLSTLRVISK